MLRIKSLNKIVPAICILSGLIAVFVAKADIGWVFVGGGILLQILVLFSGKIKGG